MHLHLFYQLGSSLYVLCSRYGKAGVRKGRKVGHITVTGPSYASVGQIVDKVCAKIIAFVKVLERRSDVWLADIGPN